MTRLTSIAFILALAWTLSSAGQDSRKRSASFQVVEATIDDIHSAFKSGKLTAHQLVQAYLDRIEAYDKNGPKLNSIITLNPNAMAEADKLDEQYKKSGLTGPLHGIPVLVKDEIDSAGMPTFASGKATLNSRRTSSTISMKRAAPDGFA